MDALIVLLLLILIGLEIVNLHEARRAREAEADVLEWTARQLRKPAHWVRRVRTYRN